MTNAAEADDKFGSEYPLPGGVENYFTTLLSLLRFVRDSVVTFEGLVDWFGTTAGATGQTAVGGYISSLGRLGLWAYQDEHIKLTPIGIAIVAAAESDEAAARKLVLELKYKLVAGYDHLFELLEQCEQSTESIQATLQSALSVEWKTRNQTAFRINWLRSLGYVEKNGTTFRLNDEGRSILHALRKAKPDPSPDRDGGASSNASALEKEAAAIGARLKLNSTKGGDGKAFEEATEAAFSFLGFETQLIGGAGNPDVLATASMGERSYRVLIDSKSRASGTVQQNDVPYPALLKQKANSNARYIVIVGPAFAGGQLAEFAREQQIRLMAVEELTDLMLAHARSAFPLDILEPLFQGGGPLDEGVLSTVQSNSEIGAEMVELARKVYMVVREFQDKAGTLHCDSIFYILKCAHELRTVKMVIDFLKSEVISAIGESANGSLHTRLSPQSLAQRLSQISSVLSASDKSLQ